jgi:uncharacterized protein (TIGR04255 family)
VALLTASVKTKPSGATVCSGWFVSRYRRPRFAGKCVVSCEVVTSGDPTFGAVEYIEVPLADPPLELALCQLRIPYIASILDPVRVAPFQDRLQSLYATMHQEKNVMLSVGPQGPIANDGPPLWRLRDADGIWSAALAPDFLALETTHYKSRDDFMERWHALLEAFNDVFEPTIYERLGIRYINRLKADIVSQEEWPSLIRDELYGALAIPMPEGGQVHTCISQAQLSVDTTQVQARWGLIPPNLVMLPNVTPLATAAWVLDIDVYTEGTRPFEPRSVEAETRSHSGHAYNFFRWAVKDEYLKRFGGEF